MRQVWVLSIKHDLGSNSMIDVRDPGIFSNCAEVHYSTEESYWLEEVKWENFWKKTKAQNQLNIDGRGFCMWGLWLHLENDGGWGVKSWQFLKQKKSPKSTLLADKTRGLITTKQSPCQQYRIPGSTINGENNIAGGGRQYLWAMALLLEATMGTAMLAPD